MGWTALGGGYHVWEEDESYLLEASATEDVVWCWAVSLWCPIARDYYSDKDGTAPSLGAAKHAAWAALHGGEE